MLTVDRLRRVEIWSNWRCAGGQRIAVINDAASLSSTEDLSGADELNLSVSPLSLAAPELIENRVICIDESDTVFDEWKITKISQSSDSAISVKAEPVASTDVAKAGIVSQVLGDGAVLHDFEGIGLTAQEHITQFLLPVLAAAGLSWLSIGTIAPLQLVDLKYSWVTPLTALRQLAQITISELQIRRNGTIGYAIDLIPQIGSTAPVADIRSEKNLQGLSIERSAGDQENRVYPKGAAADDEYGSMARAVWQVTAVSGNDITLADPAGGDDPILFDDQLSHENIHLRKVDGSLTRVIFSEAATQIVTVLNATGVSVGDLIQFRADSTGSDLTYLDSPPDIALANGAIRAGVWEQSDIPAANNLIKNPATRNWPGSPSAPPSNWGVIGTPTIGKQTSGPFVKTGGNSIKVSTNASGDGVITASVPVFPTTENPYGSGYASVWVASGKVRVELRITTPTVTLTHPVPPAVASNSVNGQFVELGVSGEDLKALGATAVALLIVQHESTPAVFYVDSAQFTQTPSQEAFVEGSGGTRLWQAANERLRTMGGLVVSYRASLLDLARIDPTVWSDAKLALGGDVRITEPRLSIAVRTRQLQITRDYLIRGQTSVVLSNDPDRITGTFARPKRVRRLPVSTDDASLNPEANPSALSLIGFDQTERADEVEFTWTRGSLVDSVWAAVLTFDLPLSTDPWDAVRSAVEPIAADQNSITVKKPQDNKITLVHVEPRDVNLNAGQSWEAQIKAQPPQTPEFESDDGESDTTGTRYVRPQTRGELVTAIQFQSRVGKEDPSPWLPPTRTAGADSYTKHRKLIGQEVEFDTRLDDTRNATITPRAILSSGEIITLPPSTFDRNTRPDITLAWAEGSIATMFADSDAKSVRIQRVEKSGDDWAAIGWEYWQDGKALRVDVENTAGNGLSGSQTAMGAGETWQIRARAYSKMRSEVTNDTLFDEAFITVHGSGVVSPTIWKYANVAAPVMGTVNVPIALEASSGGTSTRVTARYDAHDGSGFRTLGAVTGVLTPSLTTPPTTKTDYVYSGLPATYNRTVNAGGARLIELEISAQILDGAGAVIATITRSAQWYYGGSEDAPAAPTGGPRPEPTTGTYTPDPGILNASIAGPASNGLKNVTLSLLADSAIGTVQVDAEWDDDYGTTGRTITSELTPALATPPTVATNYTWNGLSSLYAKASTGTPIRVRMYVRIVKDGVVVSSRTTNDVIWPYTDTRT